MSRFNLLKNTTKEIIDLATRYEFLADKKSKLFCKTYLALKNDNETDKQVKNNLLTHLCYEHGLRTDKLFNKISLLTANQSKDDFKKCFNHISYDSLDKHLTPDYHVLFKSLSRVQDGVQTVVKIREDLLTVIEQNHEDNLKIMNILLKKLLTLWFSTGLLQLHRITWNSPAVLVEKIAHFESVHPLRSLNDLKTRLGKSRRCFIYTHTSMPNEPLVMLHVALTNKLSTNITSLLKNLETSETETELTATNAVFYSISSCQKGLKNIDLGNSLIKNCVALLQHENTGLKYFHTLSPIPGFRNWLNDKLNDTATSKFFNEFKFFKQNELDFLMDAFQIDKQQVSYEPLRLAFKRTLSQVLLSDRFRDDVVNNLFADGSHKSNRIIQEFLLRACAFYLYHEKQRGYALNSVCNFHVHNGAHIEQINFGGNLSDRGWHASFGLMVNYGYNLTNVEQNCLNYLIEKTIPVSESIKGLLVQFENNER